jgi:hypothetical protein
MSERIKFGNGCYSVDGQYRLHFGSNESEILLPCRRINDPNLLIGIIDNNNLNPKRLLILPKDRAPIRVTIIETGETLQIKYPGKSAFLYLDCNPSKNTVNGIVRYKLKSIPDRRDHLHLSTVEWIEESGWQAWWAPIELGGNLMHVRLIPSSIIDKQLDPTIIEASALSAAFIKFP